MVSNSSIWHNLFCLRIILLIRQLVILWFIIPLSTFILTIFVLTIKSFPVTNYIQWRYIKTTVTASWYNLAPFDFLEFNERKMLL